MVCQHCGSSVTLEAPAGLCPGCLLRTAAASGSRDRIPDLPRLRYFGDYELLEEIARGGMGVVYKARQMSLDRLVALKMMRPGLLATASEVARFRAEAAAAARLQHPNIVTIFEVGEQDALHYFSMDYVEGANMADVSGGRPLPERQAAQYLKTVAEAIHFAHTHGTLHRDLKPSNILIDTDDRPRVTDFGLSLPLNGGVAADVTIAGTPAYMSPEQSAGETLTAASDVYALGAILHELLGGTRINRDLETICAKCMAGEPRRRYGSAKDLADDLDRYLRREPIAARRIGLPARIWRWVRRNPWQTIAAAAIAIAAGQAYRSAVQFREQYFDGLLEQARLQRVTGNLAEAGKLVRKAAAIHDNRATLSEALELAVAPGSELLLDIPFGWVSEARLTADGLRLAVRGNGYVGDPHPVLPNDVVKVWDIATGKLVQGSSEWPESPSRGETSPDGRLKASLVVHGSTGELVVSDTITGQRIASMPDNHTPAWSSTGLLATIGGNRVATRGGSMGRDGRVAPGVSMGFSRVRVWRVRNVAPSYTLSERVRDIAVRPDDKRLSVNEAEWDIAGSDLRRVDNWWHPRFETYDARGRLWSAETMLGSPRLWCDRIEVALHNPPDGLQRQVLAVSPDGRRAALGAWEKDKVDGRVELWDTLRGERIVTLDASMRYWPDGRARFSADSSLLVVQEPHVVNDLKVFRGETGDFLRKIPISSRQRNFALLNAARTVSVGSALTIADLNTGLVLNSWPSGTMEAQDRAVTVAGDAIATAGEDRMIHLWDQQGHEIARWMAHTAEVTALAFDPTGRVLYSGADDGSLRVWDLERMRAEAKKLGATW
jgi:serine/threonine protein kinase